MRTLAITQNVTLDGSIEMLDDWFDPQARGLGDMSDLQEEVQRQSAASDAFLTGRRTFEDLRSYWPHREDDTTGTRTTSWASRPAGPAPTGPARRSAGRLGAAPRAASAPARAGRSHPSARAAGRAAHARCR